MFSKHKEKGSKLFFIGNGRSAAIASHMTEDFMKNGGMRTGGIYRTSVVTCISNDYELTIFFQSSWILWRGPEIC